MKFKKSGSAFLISVGVLSVMTLMILFFSNTRTARRWTTRLMSNEGRAEAVAEATVNMGLRMVGDQINNYGTEWYFRLRAPGKIGKGPVLAQAEGKDLPLVVNDSAEYLIGTVTSSEDTTDEYLAALKGMLDNGSWTVRLFAQIPAAAAITDKSEDYYVTGINQKPVPVLGTVGKFLERINATGESIPLSDLMSSYQLNVLLPEDHNQTSTSDTFKVKKKILFFKITLKGVINLSLPERQSDINKHSDRVRITGYVKLGPLGKIDIPPIDIKIYKDLLASMFEGDAAGASTMERFSARDLMKKITGTDSWLSYSWHDSKIAGYLNTMWTKIEGLPGLKNEWADDRVVEKLGTFRLKAEVLYEPQSGNLIQRTLVAERDFKVADLQPVAPEYVFFVNNSKDKDIKLIGIPPSGVIATSSIHPIPRKPGELNKLTLDLLNDAFGTGTVEEKSHFPGLVRLNGSKNLKTMLFAGALEEVNTTHYNALLADQSSNLQLNDANKIDPRFNWLKSGSKDMFMDTVYVPIPPYVPNQTYTENRKGVAKMWAVLNEKVTLNTPTIFFGDYMHEYPMNIQIESNMKQQYSQISVKAKVKIDGDAAMKMAKSSSSGTTTQMEVRLIQDLNNDLWLVRPTAAGTEDDDEFEAELKAPDYPGPYNVDDIIELSLTTGIGIDLEALEKIDLSPIEIKHTRKEEPFGIRLRPTTADNNKFRPSNPSTRPPALYSDLQYAKKSKHYYEDEAAFLASIPKRKTNEGVFKLDGITFVNSSFTLPAMKVEGIGLIVSRHNITVAGNIERADDETVFGLIARNGAIMVKPGTSLIQAACYSHKTLQNQAGNVLNIDGNLVMDEFDRTLFNSVRVIYNGPACRTTFLSIVREVGKYDPLRYNAVFGKRWSRYEYEKR